MKNIVWLKNQLDAVLDRNQKYFMTLGEFIWNQVNSDCQQLTKDPNLDFQAFIHDTVEFQLDAMDKKIDKIFFEFQAEQGV